MQSGSNKKRQEKDKQIGRLLFRRRLERQIAALGCGLVCVREMSQRHRKGVCMCVCFSGAVTNGFRDTCARQQATKLGKTKGRCSRGADARQDNSPHLTKWATRVQICCWNEFMKRDKTIICNKLVQDSYIVALFPYSYSESSEFVVEASGRDYLTAVLWKLVLKLFLLSFFNPHDFPFTAWPSISALWASPERCNKAGDGWGLPQQLYTIKLSHWALPDPSHMIRSIKHGHNSHLSSGDNDGVKLASLIIVYWNFNCLDTSFSCSRGCGVKFWSLY